MNIAIAPLCADGHDLQLLNGCASKARRSWLAPSSHKQVASETPGRRYTFYPGWRRLVSATRRSR